MTIPLRQHDRRPTFPTSSPHFFKIILPNTIQNKKLEIPKKFILNYGKDLSKVICLKVPSGEEWKVELTKSGGNVWFEKGWHEFAEYYSLNYGNLLVFRHLGDSKFSVLIFDRSASEIEYPFESNHHHNHSFDDDQKSPLECPRPTKMMRTSIDEKEGIMSTPQGYTQSRKGISPLTLRAREKAKALERANGFKSENPFFMVVMQPSHVHVHSKCRLGIPSHFGRKYFKNKHGGVILSSANGRVWHCKYSLAECQPRLFGGWKAFVEDNDLKLGDVCVFEMIKKSIKMSFKVIIFKAIEDTNYSLLQAESKHEKVSVAEPSMVPRGLEEANKFTSNHPVFKVVMRSGYLNNGTLTVSRSFVERHIKKEVVTVKLRVGDKLCPVKLSRYGSSTKFTRGWDAFTVEHSLQLGDVCVFELIYRNDTEMKVSIFRHQLSMK